MSNKNNNQNPIVNHQTITEVISNAKKSNDFTEIKKIVSGFTLSISYFNTLIDHNTMQKILLPYIDKYENTHEKHLDIDKFNRNLPIEDVVKTTEVTKIEDKLHNGYALLRFENRLENYILINISNQSFGLRQFNESENEFSVTGPKLGFVENLDTNINLLRRKIKSPLLITEEIVLGNMSKTRVMIVYLDSITNKQHIETVRNRLNDIDLDIIWDSNVLEQIISDNSNTPFPIYLSSERLDRITFAITNGQVAIFCDGSPYAISGPSTILDFFISSEDYYYNWIIGSLFRLIRILGIFFSIFSSSFYVAVVTFHYEMIPIDLLGPLISSRANVPFPPLLEVIFLEVTIELLREAGARLPTKIGQTLGIVGGIVIGQAAVAASLTSNVLLIIIALSALASFTTPSITMSNTIRLLRFPFIIMSSVLGGLGIMLGIAIMISHLFRLKSFGTPYMVPLHPFRINSFSDSFIRSPYSMINKRASYLKAEKNTKYKPNKFNKKKSDINEE